MPEATLGAGGGVITVGDVLAAQLRRLENAPSDINVDVVYLLGIIFNYTADM